MSLSTDERTAFVSNYTHLLINTWTDPNYLNQLVAHPDATLAEAGIELPSGSSVIIHPTAPAPAPGDADRSGVDAQIELYEIGLLTGAFDFYIPEAPGIDTAELNASELQDVAAGGEWGSYCCSCCPSCCSAAGN